jgi:D-amino-acid oxidase
LPIPSDLSSAPSFHDQSRSCAEVLVIGAGVSGLTTALCLRQKGFGVTVVADRFAPHVTSVVAGALWEWPPAVCGRHDDRDSLARAKVWCQLSYGVFADLALDPETGVSLRPSNFYFKRPIEEDPLQREKMEELRNKVQGFTHDSGLIAANQVNSDTGVRDAYAHLAPMIDTDIYMLWLLREVRNSGCRVVQAKIEGLLGDQEEALLQRFGARAIVHCAGLGAKELAEDDVFPVRGALIRVRNDGKEMPRITEAHCISHTGPSNEPGFLFIVPRGREMLLLGGLAEPGELGLNVDLENHSPIQEMHRRCLKFLPILKRAKIDAAEPIRVGLRPFRHAGVRLEREPGRRIIHNYGHGGSGVTFSWGCSQEVVRLAEELLA